MVKIELGRQNINKQSCIKPQCMIKIVRPYNCSGYVINLTSSNGYTFILNRLVTFGHKRPYSLTQHCSRYTDCKIWHEIHLKPPMKLLLKTSRGVKYETAIRHSQSFQLNLDKIYSNSFNYLLTLNSFWQANYDHC